MEIKLFINNKGPFNLYIINYCFKLRPLTPLMLSATLALAVLNDLFMVKLPLPINITALPMNVAALPINITALCYEVRYRVL